ncbi:hypothetical protein RN001_011232 [Aquatica leii]|uniref:Apolipoprotein C-I n=1 Tax=Aquatica leii TaxID=1421715 RepID=A0AAN7PAU8_9COLE|nr:hypothetical protein RN001_011232 [Aquatica leii]
MFFKYFLLAFSLIVLAQALAVPNREKRDVPTAEETGKAISDLIVGFKSNADAMLKNIQESDVYKDFTAALSKFGDAVQNEASKLAEKVKTST